MCIKQLFVCFHICSVYCWYGICCPVPTRSTVVSFPCTENGQFLPGGRQESWSKVPLPCHLPRGTEKKTPAMITDFRMELNSGPSKHEAVLLRPLGNGHHIPSTMFKWTSLITYPLPCWCWPASSPLLQLALVVQPSTTVIPTWPLTLQLSSERPNRLQDSPPPPTQSVLRAASPSLQHSEREAGQSPIHSAEIKNAWIHTSNPPIRPSGVVPTTAQSQPTMVLVLKRLCNPI